MREAVNQLSVQPDILLNDAVMLPGISIPQVPIVKGDAKSVSIAAASILGQSDKGQADGAVRRNSAGIRVCSE